MTKKPETISSRGLWNYARFSKPSGWTTITVSTESRNKKGKNREKYPLIARPMENKLLLQDLHGKERRLIPTRKNHRAETSIFAAKQTALRNTHARHLEHNAIFARRCDISPECSKRNHGLK